MDILAIVRDGEDQKAVVLPSKNEPRMTAFSVMTIRQR
jgi:hypothetical protein